MHRFHSHFRLFLICLYFLFGWNSGQSQNLPLRYATLELFTNTPCPICGSQNPGLFSRLNAYANQYHLISFYPGTPYPSCIFYKANMSENLARKNYYQIVGTPTVGINGVQFKSAGQVTNTVLDAATGGESWLEVHVEETAGNNRTVDINLEDHVGGSATTARLFAVIVEKEILYNAPNGETMHHNVFRKFLTEVAGEEVDMSLGEASKTYQYTLDPTWQADQVYVIAWLINPDTKEIYNSGTRFDPILSATSDLSNAKMDLKLYPNPATENVMVSLPEKVNEPVNMKVYSVHGQVLKSFDNLHTTAFPLHIPTNGFPSGVYYIILEGKDGSHGGKLMVE